MPDPRVQVQVSDSLSLERRLIVARALAAEHGMPLGFHGEEDQLDWDRKAQAVLRELDGVEESGQTQMDSQLFHAGEQWVPLAQHQTLLENRMHLSREVKRMRNALYAILPLADVPGTPPVVRDNLRGNIHEGLRLDD